MAMSASVFAALTVCSCCGAAAIARALAAWLPAMGMIDRPVAGFQDRAVPRGGGLAIVLPLLLLAGLTLPTDGAACRRMVIPVAAATGVAVISLVDDIRTVAVPVRLAVHVAMAALTIAVLGPIEAISAGPWGTLSFGFASWPLTLVWIVGMTNAFNFMDGVDAMAGVTTAVASMAAAAAAWLVGEPNVCALACVLGGASLGFLTVNWPPARIFMGDVGSTFCGFLLATIPLMTTATSEPRVGLIVALAASPFVLDTAVTLVRRLLRCENIFQPHRSHYYQRLVLAGWPHGMVSCLYGAAAAAAATVGMWVMRA